MDITKIVSDLMERLDSYKIYKPQSDNGECFNLGIELSKNVIENYFLTMVKVISDIERVLKDD